MPSVALPSTSTSKRSSFGRLVTKSDWLRNNVDICSKWIVFFKFPFFTPNHVSALYTLRIN